MKCQMLRPDSADRATPSAIEFNFVSGLSALDNIITGLAAPAIIPAAFALAKNIKPLAQIFAADNC